MVSTLPGGHGGQEAIGQFSIESLIDPEWAFTSGCYRARRPRWIRGAMRSKELAQRIGSTEVNVSLLRSGRVKGMRFEALAKICEVL